MKPRYTTLFSSEDRFIPAIDVERGPINGAAQERQHGSTPGRGKHHQMPSPMPAAAPPEPTYVPGVGFLPRHEPTPADSPAWVPHGVEGCPVPDGTEIYVRFGSLRVVGPVLAKKSAYAWTGALVHSYRLAKPTHRGPCVLPPDHPHAELERLYMSDDTLRLWMRCPKGEWALLDWRPHWDGPNGYHVAHVKPK